jgi:hypothetical protein
MMRIMRQLALALLLLMPVGNAVAAPVYYAISFSGVNCCVSGIAHVIIDIPAMTGSLWMPNLLSLPQFPTDDIPLSITSVSPQSLAFAIGEPGFPTNPADFPYSGYAALFDLQSARASLFTASGDLRRDLTLSDFSSFQIEASATGYTADTRDYVICPLPTPNGECPTYAFLPQYLQGFASPTKLVPEPSAGPLQLLVLVGLVGILGSRRVASARRNAATREVG